MKRAQDEVLNRFVIPDVLQPDAVSRMVLVREDSIMVTSGTKKEGVSASGKPWMRWENNIEVVSWRSGRLVDYRITTNKRVRRVRTVTSSLFPGAYLKGSMDIAEALRSRHAGRGLPPMDIMMERTHKHPNAYFDGRGGPDVAQMIRLGAFPVIAERPDWRPEIGMRITRALREPDARSFVEAAFGKRNYRKDLLRAVAGAQYLHSVDFASGLRNIVPVDWIVESLNIPAPGLGYNMYPEVSAELYGKLFKTLTPQSQRRLLLNPAENNYLVNDSVRLLDVMAAWGQTGLNPRSWREFHDDLATRQRSIGQVNREIELTKVAKKVDGKTAGRFAIVAARETDQLQQWGSLMSNCIGGYGSMAVKGSTNLFGVYEGETLVANMEIDSKGVIRQLFGRFNRSLDEADDLVIRKAVSK